MKNDCEICGEGFSTEQVDFVKGVPVYYASCSYCKCDYQNHIHLRLINQAKKEDIHAKSLAAIDIMFANMTDEEFVEGFHKAMENSCGPTIEEYLERNSGL